MSKFEIKELTILISVSLLNFFVVFFITNLLGIANTIIYRSITFIFNEITWEIIIFIGLSLIEATMYEFSQIDFKILK